MVIYSSYFELFGNYIPYYGVLFIFGILLAGLSSLHRAKKNKLDIWEVVYSAVFAAIGGIIGAKLLSILTSLDLIINAFIVSPTIDTLVTVLRDGFVFYGGLIGGLLGLFAYVKIYKLDFETYCDVFAPSVALGHAFGRIGCLFSGCCYGVEVTSGLSVTYAVDGNIANSLVVDGVSFGVPLGVKLLPIQLIESVCLFAIFIICEILFLKTNKKGIATYTYLVSYAIVRFVLEIYRGDEVRGIFILSTSQWISLAILITLIFVFSAKNIKHSKTGS